jgi:hypothetical protein
MTYEIRPHLTDSTPTPRHNTRTGTRAKLLTAAAFAATVAAVLTGFAAPAQASAAEAAPAAVAGADNTGVPIGTPLTVHNGDIVVTTPGTVLDGLDIRGMVSIKADNVTIKNSVIRGRYTSYANALINNLSGHQNLVVTDVELAASTPSPNWSGIYGYNLTATRLNIHDVVDGIHLTGGNTVIQKSWIHDNTHYDQDPNHGGTPTHDDAIQIQVGANIRIDGNTIRDQYSASVMITQDRGKVSNVSFTNNTADGGKCSINLAEKTYGPILGTVVSDNTFGRDTRVANCAVISANSSKPTMERNFYTPDNAVVGVHAGS